MSGPRPGLVVAVALLAGGLIGYEIGLMRVLLVASWHHFAFLVISLALLGFGASGTLLCFGARLVRRWPVGVFAALLAATAVSMPGCAAAAQQIPVEARIVPGALAEQAAAWTGFFAVLTVPFALGASGIGAALMAARERAGAVYAADLVGSGAGAVLVTGLMALVPPAWLPTAIGAAPAAALLAVPGVGRTARFGLLVGAVAAVGGLLALAPPRIRPDPYKAEARVKRLAAEGRAERIARAWGPRGLVEVYAGNAFHHVPFLGTGATPPPIATVLIDGHRAGSLIARPEPADASAVDRTLMAAPYGLLRDRPRVLILNEVGNVNTALALRRGARRVRVVQPSAALVGLWRGSLRAHGGAVFADPRVHVVRRGARHDLEHGTRRFDLIQLAGLQSIAAGAGGMGGLAENHLVTVDGMRAALGRLSPDGMLFVCRGIKSPPRDNLKLFATFAAALRARGVERPGRHVAIVRDYLGVCTMVRKTPWSREEVQRIRAVCEKRRLTPVWFPGIRDEELNRPDALPGPAGEAGGWYHHAAEAIFGGRAEAFFERWRFDIRPPTDDRPFFHDFCKLSALGAIREAYGRFWLTRVEVGYLFVLAALALAAAVALGVAVLPLFALRGVRRAPGKAATSLYFLAIGLGYLMLEVTALSRMTRLIGDPVIAAALVIGTFLAVSGLGSAAADRLRTRGARLLPGAVGAIVAAAVGAALAFEPLAATAGGLPLAGRAAVGVALVAPMAFAMGVPMPVGLGRVSAGAPALVPWAWGINGFGSVIASPLTIALAMSFGYRVPAVAGLGLYAVALAAAPALPGRAGAE